MGTATKFKPNRLALALMAATMTYPTGYLMAEDNVDDTIEEVVATASRLKGSASAVIEERKQQAFVADIMGAEQISRSGDSDAASALRRVTGLTLVNGKFVYVRGLGERYSSTRLNGASVPSPDLTRNVIPLDIFPSSILESLAVQKSYSPDMPAAFGGGNIDIRTKTIPSSELFEVEFGMGHGSIKSGGFSYNGSDDDWLGTDDGKRALPGNIRTALDRYKGDFSIANIISTERRYTGETISADQAMSINKGFAKALNRDVAINEETLKPDVGFSLAYGNSYEEDYFGGTFGFMAALNYDRGATASKETSAVTTSSAAANGCDSGFDITCFDAFSNTDKTVENTKLNAVLNFGYEIDNHSVTMSNMMIRDTEDEIQVSITEKPGQQLTFGEGKVARSHLTKFEERELTLTQFRGQHTFPEYMGIGVDWQYTDATAKTEVPNEVEFRVRDNYENGSYQNTVALGASDIAKFGFVGMEDKVESYGWNASLPIYADRYELELKAGADFLRKARDYRTDVYTFDFQEEAVLVTSQAEVLGLGGAFSDSFIDSAGMIFDFDEPSTDDYVAAQTTDAFYGSFDLFLDNKWRFSGGVRWEDFKQTSLAFSRQIYDVVDFQNILSAENIKNATIVKDDYFGSLALTYTSENDYQVRLAYGETVVRPDVRELAPVLFIDPLTDLKTIGTPGLLSSLVKNYDARVEFYEDDGDNYSIAAFYKDIANPIEAKLLVFDNSYGLTYINGESAEVMGVEGEWMFSLTPNIFTSGNITLSDSEVTIDPAKGGQLTNFVKRMTGHSEYVANLQLGYDSDDGMHSASVVYNIFGERILASGVDSRDEAYEQPFHSLDVVYTYYPSFSTKLKVKVKNLLGEDFEVVQDNITVKSREVGTTLSIDFSWEL